MKQKNIQQLRLKTNLSQEQASKILEVTKEYLSMIECGRRNPSDTLKKEMAKLYDVTISDIFLAIEKTKCFKKKEVK